MIGWFATRGDLPSHPFPGHLHQPDIIDHIPARLGSVRANLDEVIAMTLHLPALPIQPEHGFPQYRRDTADGPAAEEFRKSAEFTLQAGIALFADSQWHLTLHPGSGSPRSGGVAENM